MSAWRPLHPSEFPQSGLNLRHAFIAGGLSVHLQRELALNLGRVASGYNHMKFSAYCLGFAYGRLYFGENDLEGRADVGGIVKRFQLLAIKLSSVVDGQWPSMSSVLSDTSLARPGASNDYLSAITWPKWFNVEAQRRQVVVEIRAAQFLLLEPDRRTQVVPDPFDDRIRSGIEKGRSACRSLRVNGADEV